MPPTTGALHYPTRILCATDFTPFSRRALEYARALARPAGAEITLLHVLLWALPSIGSDDEPDWMPSEPGGRSEVLERMRPFAEPADAAGLRTRTLLQEDILGPEPTCRCLCVATPVHPSSDIRDLARNESADLIVIGNHDRGLGVIGYLASTSAQVVRNAAWAVITMPWPARRGAGALLPSPAA